METSRTNTFGLIYLVIVLDLARAPMLLKVSSFLFWSPISEDYLERILLLFLLNFTISLIADLISFISVRLSLDDFRTFLLSFLLLKLTVDKLS